MPGILVRSLSKMRLRRAVILLLPLLLALSTILSPALRAEAAAPAEAGGNWQIANGWFFTEAAGGLADGFAVTDDGGVAIWKTYQAMGGARTLGYPISWRYVGDGGFVYQAFQAGVLQWQPAQSKAVLVNTFELMQESNKDSMLLSKGVPRPISDDGSKGNWERAKDIRLGWMTNDAIRRYYLSSPVLPDDDRWTVIDSINLYGLPMSQPVRSGPFLVQRFQRVALQLWLEQVPNMPAPGTVVRVLGGDMLKDAGLLPVEGLRPLPANSPYLRIDPVLRRPVEILYGTRNGRRLVEVMQQNGVPIVMEQSDNPRRSAYFQYFRKGQTVVPGTSSIQVNTRWVKSDPKALAAVLAHEGTHADLLFNHIIPSGQELSCEEEEQEAYSAGAGFWEEMYGPRGKAVAADDLDRELNYELSYRGTPAFLQSIVRVCREAGRR